MTEDRASMACALEEAARHLETTRHAGSVHRHQVLASEIELAVLIDQTINRGQPRRLADGHSQLVEGLTLDACRAHALRDEGRPLRRREPPQQELGTDLWRSEERRVGNGSRSRPARR